MTAETPEEPQFKLLGGEEALAFLGMGQTQVVEVHHHDIEQHAESYNEGYEAAMAHQLMSDDEIEHKSPEEWLAEKLREAQNLAVIETEEQLRDLPTGSVILSQVYVGMAGTPVCFQQLVEGNWFRGGRARTTHPHYFLPALLLHRGESEAKQ